MEAIFKEIISIFVCLVLIWLVPKLITVLIGGIELLIVMIGNRVKNTFGHLLVGILKVVKFITCIAFYVISGLILGGIIINIIDLVKLM